MHRNNKNNNTMKRFDFRRELKGMNVESLKRLEEYHKDYAWMFFGFNDKESAKHTRYAGYCRDELKRLGQ